MYVNFSKRQLSVIEERRESGWMNPCAPLEAAEDGKRNNRESALEITTRQSILPLFLAYVLYAVWGFTSGLLEVLNKHFQVSLGVSKKESAALQGAFFIAYLIEPPTIALYCLRRFGYRMSFVLGLTIFGIGTILYWPSAEKRSFVGFCVATFVIGSGFASLETAAFPFVAVCGPLRFSELRLNLALAVQSTMQVISIVMASYVIFGGRYPQSPSEASHGSTSLDSVKWIYLGIAIVVFVLAGCYYFAPIPEITDEDVTAVEQAMRDAHKTDKEAATQPRAAGLHDGAQQPLRRQHALHLGMSSIFFYAGAQAAIAAFFMNYATEVPLHHGPYLGAEPAAHRLAIAHALFAMGRFFFAFLIKYVRPKHLLLFATSATLVLLSTVVSVPYVDVGIAMLMIEFFAKSCISPTTFSLALKGLELNTKKGASWLIAAHCGGGVLAPAMGAVAEKAGIRLAMGVPLAGMVITAAFPVFVNTRFWRHGLDTD